MLEWRERNAFCSKRKRAIKNEIRKVITMPHNHTPVMEKLEQAAEVHQGEGARRSCGLHTAQTGPEYAGITYWFPSTLQED